MGIQSLFDLLNKITDISPNLLIEISRSVNQEFYKTRQLILGEGQVNNRAWFIHSGFARSYFYDDNGEEHTLRFWCENELIFSPTGFFDVPSKEYIEILADTELYSINYIQLKSLVEKHSEFLKIISILLKREVEKDHQRHIIYTLPSEKRYIEFRKSNPAVFKKASLKVIASYLRMSRESLSRFVAK